MENEKITSDSIPFFIDKILKVNDPAVIGLRRIIKRKNEEGTSFPARDLLLEEFDVPGKTKILTDDERRILELEKKVIELEIRLKSQIEAQKKAEESAYSKGCAEGIKKGIEKGISETTSVYEKKIDEIQEYIQQILLKIENEKYLIYSDCEHSLLKLCFEMTKKIIQTEVDVNRNVVLAVLKKALTYIADREHIIIHVSPDDVITVSERKDFWASITEKMKNISIEEDDRIEKGGCLIESNSGLVDARLTVQYEELKQIIEKEWEDNRKNIICSIKPAI